MNHIELVHSALAAIDKVLADTSVPASDTVASLEEIRDHIDTCIDAALPSKEIE